MIEIHRYIFKLTRDAKSFTAGAVDSAAVKI